MSDTPSPQGSLSKHPRPGKSRRWLFRLMALLVVVVVCEVLAAALLIVKDRRIAYWAVGQQQRDEILGSQANGAAAQPRQREIRQTLQEFAVHPYVGYTLDPTKSDGKVSPYGFVRQYTYDVRRSKRTGRSDEIPRRRKGRRVIAIVGGSVAGGFAGYGMPTLIEELHAAGVFPEEEYLVLHLAHGGYKQPQQLMVVNYLLSLGAEIDAIVNLDGFNEVALHDAENGPQGVFYAYPRAWYQFTRTLPDKEFLRLQAQALEAERRRKAWAAWASVAPLRFSAVVNVVWRLGDRALDIRLRALRKAYRLHRADKKPPYKVTGPTRVYDSETQKYEDLVGIWARCSRLLDRLCKANDIEYFHFLQPNQYLEGTKPMSDAERRIAIRQDHPYRKGADIGYPMMQEAGQRLVDQGVAFFDVTDAFQGHEEPLYNDDCCHFSKEGQQILARRMARAIVDSGAAARP